MGTSIYIKKSALTITSTERVLWHSGCHCGATSSGICEECHGQADDWYDMVCHVKGLAFPMQDFDDMVCHVANAWGSSRQSLLNFIKLNNISPDDWYEG
jgi:hypothetical protein